MRPFTLAHQFPLFMTALAGAFAAFHFNPVIWIGCYVVGALLQNKVVNGS